MMMVKINVEVKIGIGGDTRLARGQSCLFSKNRISAENVLTQQSGYSVRSLSEIIPQLCRFELS
jgi:hypothetical protein